MSSTLTLLAEIRRIQNHATECGLPSLEAGLQFMLKVEQDHAQDNEEKRQAKELWQQKRPAVASYYSTHPNAELDYNDVASAVGIPPTRGNRSRIARELKLLGYNRATCQVSEAAE
jgi:hypothetical protein